MIDKHKLKGVQTSKRSAKPINTDEIPLEKLVDVKPKQDWEQETKEYFEVTKNELCVLGILAKIDLLQFFSAFEIYNQALKIKMEIDKIDNIDKKIIYTRQYVNYIKSSCDLLDKFLTSPKGRLQLAQNLLESKQKHNDHPALKLIEGDKDENK
ncbi:MAG: hypothetical protein QXG00_04880 [Candidatus Woesearchaeota archaeon]